MRYAFILGRVFTLSVAELFSVLSRPDASASILGGPIKILDASPEVVIIETEKPLDALKLQRKLGGIVKILAVIDIIKKREQDSVNFALKHYFKPSVLKKQFFKDYKGKMQFGVSIYLLEMDLAKPQHFEDKGKSRRPPVEGQRFNSVFGEPKRVGMMIKNTLTESGQSIRLVLPEFNSLALASVVVTKNLLLDKGAEICVLAGKTKVYTARTLVVQDFEDYGRRDYQRPVRDEKQGMIPPKVAQIMLNLSGAKAGATVLDPFCGIGTMLQEGILLGFRMLGSDINKMAIRGSEQNLEWFRNRYRIAPGKYHVETADARSLAPLLQEQKIEAIVTEGTLGPIYSSYPKQNEIQDNFAQLKQLYKDSFAEFSKLLPSGGRVVMCLPAYRKNRDQYGQLPGLDFASELGYTQLAIISPEVSQKFKFLKLTERGTAIYDRKDQIVAREIVLFEKS